MNFLKRLLVIALIFNLQCTKRVLNTTLNFTQGNYCDYADDYAFKYKGNIKESDVIPVEDYLVVVKVKSSSWQVIIDSDTSYSDEYIFSDEQYWWKKGFKLFSQNIGDTLIRLHSGFKLPLKIDSMDIFETSQTSYMKLSCSYINDSEHKRTEYWHRDIGLIAIVEVKDNIKLDYTLKTVQKNRGDSFYLQIDKELLRYIKSENNEPIN